MLLSPHHDGPKARPSQDRAHDQSPLNNIGQVHSKHGGISLESSTTRKRMDNQIHQPNAPPRALHHNPAHTSRKYMHQSTGNYYQNTNDTAHSYHDPSEVPSVLVLGNSLLNSFDPGRFSSEWRVDCLQAYTCEQAITELQNLGRNYSCIILQLITNDIEELSITDCTDYMIETVKCCQNYSDVQVISLAPPRGDSMDLDHCISQVNKKLEEYFENDHSVHICSNINLTYQGCPIDHLFQNDKIHLSRMGSIRLYKNLKYMVHKCFGTSFNDRPERNNNRYRSLRANCHNTNRGW